MVSFLAHIEELNKNYAPFPESTRLITWDIENYYPNCDTPMCIQAVKEAIVKWGENSSPNIKECVCEASEITMSSYNGEIDNKHFTQIQGATIGGPDSASITDIFGGRIIDTVARNGGPFEPRDWRRYRDDTWNIEGGGGNAKVERLEEFTQYLNQNVLQERIIFKLKHDEREIAFLDTTVRLINGYLLTEIYSIPTDAHQYLHASTSHPKHTIKSIPYSVGLRIRRNCSDKVQGDQYFAKNLVEYRRHLLKCGYASENKDREFLKAAKIEREKNNST